LWYTVPVASNLGCLACASGNIECYQPHHPWDLFVWL